MKTLFEKFLHKGDNHLSLKELVRNGREFLGEDMPDPRNTEISNALYAAIGLKYLIGLNQFSQEPSLQGQVRKSSEKIQSVLNQYRDSEAKDISTDDLTSLLNEMNTLPKLAVIKDNTTEKANLNSNLVAECISILKDAIPALSHEHKKRNSHKI